MKSIIIWMVVFIAGVAQSQQEQAPENAEDEAVTVSEEVPQPALKQQNAKPRIYSACMGNEPDVQKVVRAAWEEAGLLRDDDVSRAGRVRASGWLPRIAGGVSKDMDDSRDYRYEPGDPRVDQIHLDKSIDWDVGLSWEMSDIVFRSEELQVAREASRRSRERLNLANEVIRLYFTRKKLLYQGGVDNEADFEIRLAEITATLNVWTGGRFERLWCGKKGAQP